MPYQDKDPHRTGIGAKFATGRIVYSDGVTALLAGDPVAATSLNAFLRFHQNGQWGHVAAEDAHANEQALMDGGVIFSCYQLQGRSIVIITDAEPRETTRVLLRDEYEAG